MPITHNQHIINMKQKVILYNKATDQTMYFSSYEEASKHLDVKASKLQRIANTGEVINYIYTINTK